MKWNRPTDVEWQCNAHLYIADDYGDNRATMRCNLSKGHPGHHQESFKREGHGVCVQWEVDERDYSAHPLYAQVDPRPFPSGVQEKP